LIPIIIEINAEIPTEADPIIPGKGFFILLPDKANTAAPKNGNNGTSHKSSNIY